jgi:hypothetical protein
MSSRIIKLFLGREKGKKKAGEFTPRPDQVLFSDREKS